MRGVVGYLLYAIWLMMHEMGVMELESIPLDWGFWMGENFIKRASCKAELDASQCPLISCGSRLD